MASVKKASFSKRPGSKLKLRNWRVEASVPAIQWVEAATKEDAIRVAVENPESWEIYLEAPIEAEHVIDVEAEDE